jgi:8-oxo-dGTP pyrophosphatase MutT (NUDIX family)
MVRRNDKVAFMAGSYVFPGGRVDAADHPAVGVTLPPPTFADLTPSLEAAYRTAAVRELQEEASVVITAADLHPYAHWVTPEIEIRRYDTRFFLARMPEGQTAKHDEGETTALEWLSPLEAIARFEQRELLLPPPTFTTIRQLAHRSSIDDVLAWAKTRRIARVMPGFTKNGDEVMLTLPGDPLFPTIPDWEVPEETRFVLEDGARWRPLKA